MARRLVGAREAGGVRYARVPVVLWDRWLGEREGGPSSRHAMFIAMVYEMGKHKNHVCPGPGSLS